MICATRADAEELSRRARALRQEAGEIRGEALALPCGEVAFGDRVMALRNDRLLSVENGMRGTVVGVDRGRGVEMKTTSGRRVVLPGWYLADGHLTYADAITAHKAQGLTAERAFVLGTRGVSREWGYAALSRARRDTRLYLEAEAGNGRDLDELGGRHDHRSADALSRLADDLSRDQAKELARAREPELSRRLDL
jgi:ATP-dependent exoDNAse (exonuclease V) alpha subunit